MTKDRYSIIRKKITDISIVKYPIISFLFCIILITGPAAAFADGDGSVENPYQISNVNELQNIQNELGANYVLINNIDASVTSEWNDGAGFEPIGDYDYRFTGFLMVIITQYQIYISIGNLKNMWVFLVLSAKIMEC